jgi:hypothetical protein
MNLMILHVESMITMYEVFYFTWQVESCSCNGTRSVDKSKCSTTSSRRWKAILLRIWCLPSLVWLPRHAASEAKIAPFRKSSMTLPAQRGLWADKGKRGLLYTTVPCNEAINLNVSKKLPNKLRLHEIGPDISQHLIEPFTRLYQSAWLFPKD